MRVTLYLLIWLIAGASGYVGQWHSYTNKEHVACMQPFGDRMFVGTSGGIREIHPITLEEKVYGNLDGLLEADIVAMTATPSNRLWAASRKGYLYEWDGKRWQVYGRSYVSTRWRPNLRAAVAVGKSIVLGTDKGLTFFDTDLKVARVNLNKFANQFNVSVLSLVRKGDTLFIGTETGAFKAAVDWDNLLSNKYVSIFDPNAWLPISFPPQFVIPDPPKDSTDSTDSTSDPVVYDSVPRRFDQLVFRGDSLESYPRGTVQSSPIEVEAILGRPFKVAGRPYPEFTFFEVSAQIGNTIFLGGPVILAVITDAKASTPVSPYIMGLISRNVPWDTLLNITSSGGTTLAMSTSTVYRKNGEKWDILPGFTYASPEILTRNLRNLVLDGNTAYIGSWGYGIVRLRDGKEDNWDVGNTPCMDTVLNGFTVINAISKVRDGLLWATVFKKEAASSYDLVYLDTERGKVTCPGVGGSGVATHRVKIFSNAVVAVAGAGGTDLFTYDRQGGLQVRPWKSIRSGSSSESWDVEMDSFGRVWSLMSGKLVYADSLESRGASIEPKTMDGFAGLDCRQMEADAFGALWIGCSNGLFRFSPATDAAASLSTRFSLDEGLLSNTISDLSVDKANGQVWVATEIGVSMYESESRPLAADAGNIKVYPNPFRSKHRFVLFDNLPAGADVRIHTSSGNVVRYFSGSEIKGGQCQWNGENTAGNKVTPGIYLYSIDGGGKTKHGKIIVDR